MSNASDLRQIATRCARLGLRVDAMPGWETRGRPGTLRPSHVILHHTGSARDVDGLLRDGRRDDTGRMDLPGPLCNLALHADGTVVLVAAGRANHAGEGTVSNGVSLGIECTGPPFSRNYQAYLRLVCAIRQQYGWGPERVLGHKETCRPKGRKIDPSFDMVIFRGQVTRLLTSTTGKPKPPAKPPAKPAAVKPPPKPAAAPGKPIPAGEVDMLLVRQQGTTSVYSVLLGALVWVPSRQVIDAAGKLGLGGQIHDLPADHPFWKLPKLTSPPK